MSEVEAAFAAGYAAAQQVQDQGSTGTAYEAEPTQQPRVVPEPGEDQGGVT